MNIRENFLKSEQYDFQEMNILLGNHSIIELKGVQENINEDHRIFLGLIDEPLISLRDLKFSDSKFEVDLLIFASRHRSQTARPAFLVHSTGNWSEEAEHGGYPHQLSKTSALLLKTGYNALLSEFRRMHFESFTIDLEVTHHGPTSLNTPLIFMELGSSIEEWSVKEAGKFVSRAIISAISNYIDLIKDSNQKIGLGFGGTHYAPNFSRILSENDVAISFICPKYYLTSLDSNIINQMIVNTLEEVNYFIIDWKGTSSTDKKHLIQLLETFDIPIIKTKDFKAD